SRTACQNIRRLNVKILNEFWALLLLIRRWWPFHVENFLFRSHEIFRLAMTLQTPLHLQGCCLCNHRHLIDADLASRRAYAVIHMNGVIERRDFGKDVKAD